MAGDFSIKGKESVDLFPQDYKQPQDVNPKHQEPLPLVPDKDIITQNDLRSKPHLKASKLDYTKFPKANRLDASEFAERSINEVKDLVREFNKDFPQDPYFPNYDDFPRPETYTPKQYGSKDKAYIAWKSAVKEWVEDCKQDMDAIKDVGIQDLANRFERTIESGFFNLYIQNGLTQQEIYDVYQALEGDINKVKQELDTRIKKDGAFTRQVVKDAVADQANWVVGEVRRESDGIHQHLHEIDMASTNRDFEIMDKVDKINDKIEEEDKKAELKTQVGEAMRNNPQKATKVIQKTLNRHGIQYDKDNAWSTNHPTQTTGAELLLNNLKTDVLEDIVDKLKYEGLL